MGDIDINKDRGGQIGIEVDGEIEIDIEIEIKNVKLFYLNQSAIKVNRYI